jgi:photosystem II stability/assembly factor-like uncharacterized protein
MNVVAVEGKTVTTKTKGQKKATTVTTWTKGTLEAKVNDLELENHRWLAATSTGLYSSRDQGKVWKPETTLAKQDFVSVRAQGDSVVAATRSSVFTSNDGGSSWKQGDLPSYVVSIRSAAMSSEGQFVIASREGAFRSGDGGATWEHMLNGLPAKDITSVSFDSTHKRLLATSDSTGVIFESLDGGRSWQRGPDTGYPLRRVSVVGGRFIGATPFDGVILQPETDPISAAADAGTNQ